MNTVFMGTPQFAVNALDTLISNGIKPVLVVTQPDRAQGRKKDIIFSPVKKRALELELPVRQYEKIKNDEALEEIYSLKPELIIVSAFGQILPKALLNMPEKGCINVHASLLPKYRGASPINYCLLNGETKAGITTMLMDEGLDTGDILLQDEIEIEPEDDAVTLTAKLAKLSEKTLTNTLGLLNMDIPLTRTKQDESKSSYAPMIKKEDAYIDFKLDSVRIINMVRAYKPWPIAHAMYQGKMWKIYSAKDTGVKSEQKPGTITRLTGDSIIVSTGTSDIQILELQKEGKTKMPVKEFLRGNKPETGSVFTSKPE